jgi:hypothetical protein
MGKPKRKRPLRKLRLGWNDNIKMYHRNWMKCYGLDYLSEDRDE